MLKPACLPRLWEYLPEAAEDTADEGGTQAALLVDVESPAVVAALVYVARGEIVASSAPALSEVPATVDTTRA